jgi:archaetidylinositol phosphate synthase
MIDKNKAVRVNQSLTKGLEAKWLPVIAKALPGWVKPDHMTLLAILATFIIAAGFLLTHISPWFLMLSNAGLILHWYGDSLDGTLARVRKCERERYGYFVDHVCDIGSVVLIAIAMGASPLLHMEIALLVALAYSMMNVYVHIVAYTRQKFLLSHGKIGPTEFRIILIIINTMVIFWNPVILSFSGEPYRAMDVAGAALAMMLFLMFLTKSISGARQLNAIDTGREP